MSGPTQTDVAAPHPDAKIVEPSPGQYELACPACGVRAYPDYAEAATVRDAHNG